MSTLSSDDTSLAWAVMAWVIPKAVLMGSSL